MSIDLLMAASGPVSAAPTKTYIEDVFSAYQYLGTRAAQIISNGIDLAGKGGAVFFKIRDTAAAGSNNWAVYDTERGQTKLLETNTTAAELTSSGSSDCVFRNDGFSMDTDTSWSHINYNTGQRYMSYTFRKAKKFFDVVKYTGDGVVGRKIPHSLGIRPGLVMIKPTSGVGDWYVGCRKDDTTQYYGLILDSTAAGSGTVSSSGYMTDVDFTPSGMSGATSTSNASGVSYIAYLFAHDPDPADSLIKCGSFTTDASGNATVDLGFEPQLVLFKPTAVAGAWSIHDENRGWFLPTTTGQLLNLNAASAESTLNTVFKNSTGFTFAAGGQPSKEHLYMAIRRGPMKKPTSASQVYKGIARTGTSTNVTLTGAGFPPDLALVSCRNGAVNPNGAMANRSTAINYSGFSANTAEASSNLWSGTGLSQDGVGLGVSSCTNNSSFTYVNHLFRRYPGVFDTVFYTGDGSGGLRQITHKLGVKPELIITKARSVAQDYQVMFADRGFTLPSTNAAVSNGGINSYATDTYTTPNAMSVTATPNAAGTTYLAHLFATLSGVSKVGSYVGDGTVGKTVDCGFSAGARFVMIKRADAAGDWYVWDSARGIVDGNDPHSSLNTTAAEVTTDDSVDPTAAGFIVNQVAATNINVSGATYMFLAIA